MALELRRAHDHHRPRRGRRTVLSVARVLRRGRPGGAHSCHCLGELFEQVQPRLTRTVPGSVETHTVTPPSSRWVELTSATVVVSPGAACGERGLDDGRPGMAAPVPEFLRALLALSGMLGAVGSVTGQSTTVGGHNGIEEVLQLPDARQVVQEQRDRSSEGRSHQRVYRLGAAVATAVGCYRPGGCLALFDGESYRSRDASLLEGHRRHATVAIERLK